MAASYGFPKVLTQEMREPFKISPTSVMSHIKCVTLRVASRLRYQGRDYVHGGYIRILGPSMIRLRVALPIFSRPELSRVEINALFCSRSRDRPRNKLRIPGEDLSLSLFLSMVERESRSRHRAARRLEWTCFARQQIELLLRKTRR